MKRIKDEEMKERLDRNLRNHGQANIMKDKLYRKGFRYTISLYGVLQDNKIGHRTYRRIEVYMNGSPNQFDVNGIREFFHEVKPYHYYSIWAYHKKAKEILLMGSWD